ncbi:hypothetical protein GCM10007416_35100 [Kroppenstedtia guangzhouensis]|uniref:Lipoprotein n=1 Tax=Kroppenstedtia guangzhouensis TaxID=1274356 RepID=A0ABQ1H533_9BACL|nr:hypothetical protein GCM10007416_35100 [Kroppenstedtia guangzhouensis]
MRMNLKKVYKIGSFALIGCGIFRFFDGIHGTPDVPNGDVPLGIPWSPYFMGYVEGDFYVGAKSLGTIFFPGVEFLMGVPIPVIWPALLGVLFLWTSPHPARTEANERVMGK